MGKVTVISYGDKPDMVYDDRLIGLCRDLYVLTGWDDDSLEKKFYIETEFGIEYVDSFSDGDVYHSHPKYTRGYLDRKLYEHIGEKYSDHSVELFLRCGSTGCSASIIRMRKDAPLKEDVFGDDKTQIGSLLKLCINLKKVENGHSIHTPGTVIRDAIRHGKDNTEFLKEIEFTNTYIDILMNIMLSIAGDDEVLSSGDGKIVNRINRGKNIRNKFRSDLRKAILTMFEGE